MTDHHLALIVIGLVFGTTVYVFGALLFCVLGGRG